MGLQILCGVYTEAQEEADFRYAASPVWGDIYELVGHKESKILEGYLMADHVQICLSIPTKYAVSNVLGDIKDKSAIQIVRKFGDRQKNFTGEYFWARGYFVTRVGLDETLIRA